ncbi:MAG: hypothetical protein HY321_06600 [Armatimonadetes bacterium]|nr:hypothetical protein [Armatimonadota bacterium]
MKRQRMAAWGAAAVALALLLGGSGCGRAFRSDDGGDPSATSRVTVAPTSDGTVRAGESVKFVAVSAGSDGQPVSASYSWAVEPADLGDLFATGAEAVFTGKKPGTGKISAVASNGVRGEAQVTVVAGEIANLRVESQNAKTTLEAGETEHFVVTGEDLGQNVVGQSRSRVVLTPVWTVTNGIGTITTGGDFTAAGAGIGKSGQIIATVDNLQGSITINVVAGSRATFVGADSCKGCHATEYAAWKTSNHSSAYDKLKAMGRMPGCQGCHVVGLGQGGFVDEATTPGLTNIQCENCHGAASLHVAGGGDKAQIRTGEQVLAQPQICGDCHTGGSHGTFEEWQQSPHATHGAHPADSFEAGTSMACGLCHSGLIRRAIKDDGKTVAEISNPTFGAQAAAVSVPCATCHDPHKKTAHERQLRYPTSSTAYFGLNSSSPQWDDSIQICGQCHNGRAAAVSSTSRPPHHSPQYNMLVGDFGPKSQTGLDPAPATAQSAHRTIEGQCTHCHMYSKAANHSTGAPGVFGHTFHVDLRGCAPCHSEADAGARRASTKQDITNRMNALKARLDAWAATSPLYATYGNLAWEYTNEGVLSNPNEDSALVGPSTADQRQIPAAVKQARFNLYLVLHDGSYGSHNAAYARWMLDQGHAALTAAGIP